MCSTQLTHAMPPHLPGARAVQMPRLEGALATRLFRTWEREHRPDAPRLPIIALSANVFDEAVTECTHAGMDGFVSKPLRLDMLRAVLAPRLLI